MEYKRHFPGLLAARPKENKTYNCKVASKRCRYRKKHGKDVPLPKELQPFKVHVQAWQASETAYLTTLDDAAKKKRLIDLEAWLLAEQAKFRAKYEALRAEGKAPDDAASLTTAVHTIPSPRDYVDAEAQALANTYSHRTAVMLVRLKDPEKARTQGRVSDAKRNETRSEQNKKRRCDDPVYAEHVRNIERKYRGKDPEGRRKRERERYAQDAEAVRETKRQYRQANAKQIKYTSIAAHCKKETMPIDIAREEAYVLFDQPCYYCGKKATEAMPNGLDRKDNSGGYTKANVLTCCTSCNMGRGDLLSPTGFIQHCSSVVMCQGQAVALPGTTVSPVCQNWDIAWQAKYNTYKRNAIKMGRAFELTEQYAKRIAHAPCYYCSGEPIKTSGYDRKDNTSGYKDANVLPCCWSCNRIKRDLSVEAFYAKCLAIACRHKLVKKTQQPPRTFVAYKKKMR